MSGTVERMIAGCPEIRELLVSAPPGTYKSGDCALKPFPPADHHRRCRHIYVTGYRVGTRCRRWALKNATKCATHGGRVQQRKGEQWARWAHQGAKGLPVFYAKVLGPTIQERLRELTEAPCHEQLALREELALMRVAACDVVQLYDATCQAVDRGDVKPDAKLIVGAGMRAALGEVADLVEKASRIELGMKDKITVQHIWFIVNQINRIAYECFGETNMEAVYNFERRIREEVRLPSDQNQGTTITPDQDVLDMDATVPREPTLLTHEENDDEANVELDPCDFDAVPDAEPV